MKSMGIGDSPITGRDGDLDFLGIGTYAKALTKFAMRCDTPLTIGLQGDWGSGKTSLMKLMLKELEDEQAQSAAGAKKLATVWINTWKYAQLGDPETLFLSVLQGIVEALAKFMDKEITAKTDKLFRSIHRWGTAAGKTAANVAMRAATQGAVGMGDVAGPGVPDAPLPHHLASDLKDSLQELVKLTASQCGGRVLLFVVLVHGSS